MKKSGKIIKFDSKKLGVKHVFAWI